MATQILNPPRLTGMWEEDRLAILDYLQHLYEVLQILEAARADHETRITNLEP